MLNRSLTEQERCFASENHRLILAYLARRGLPEEEYYAVAALGYLSAVRRYLSEPQLRRHAFSTVANRAMRQSISHAMRSRYGRRYRAETISLDTGGADGTPIRAVSDERIEQQLEEVLLLHALAAQLSPQQYELAGMRLAGYSVREIAAAKKLSTKKVRLLLRKAKGICKKLCERT